jgi:hypothetical protein
VCCCPPWAATTDRLFLQKENVMMKLKTTASLLVLVGLMGCSTLVPEAYEQPVARFGPTPVLTPQLSVSESMYGMARLAHEQGQLATAAQRYRRTLQMKPDHVGALNGLGVILAQDGRTNEALELLVRARDLSPQSGHIHNNLGYTLLREQRLDEAQVALRLARELQPGNQQTQRNLALLEKARADQVRQTAAAQPQPTPAINAGRAAAPAQIVSVAPQVFELRLSGTLASLQASPVAAVPAAPAAAVPEVQAVLQAPVRGPEPMKQPEPLVVQPTARIVPAGEPGVMVLQMTASLAPAKTSDAAEPDQAQAPVSAPLQPSADVQVTTIPMPSTGTEVARVEPLPQPEAGYRLVLSRELTLQQGPFAIWTDIRGVKLEISNGVGVERLARRTADRLAQEGVATARLTNTKPYRQLHTQIEYAPGQEAAVQALAARLPVPVEMVPVAKLERDMSLRLVLGQDAVGRTIANWLDGDTTHLAVNTSGMGREG